MRRTRLAAALLLSTLAVVALALPEKEHPSALFREYCAKCHGEDGTGNTPKGKQLQARDFTDSEFLASKTDVDLIKTVTKGGEDMPSFGKKLSKEQIEGLVRDDVRGFRKKGSR